MIKCRICKNNLKRILDLGKISLVGNFRVKNLKEKKYKISLNYCLKCKHVQISELLNPNTLFKNYLWETGISVSNLKLINEIIKKLKQMNCNRNSKILEIACNDCTFLEILNKKINCQCVGIDPARNLIKKNKSKKITKINDYFNTSSANKIYKRYGSFDFIFARNVIAHVKNPVEIFSCVNKLLKKNGVFIIEFPSLLNIIKFNQYDNIFHEHIGFHSLRSIQDLSKMNNLNLFDAKLIDSQGGSFRCFISKQSIKKETLNLQKFKKIESKNKLFSKSNLMQFKNRINTHREKMQIFLKKIKKKNKKISIYGASGKGLALMQYCNISKEIIDFVFDKSKLKQNRYTPGTNIKVLNPNKINLLKPDYLLLLSWNLKKEIIKQEKNYLKNGGKFIIPFPKPHIIIR